MPSGTGGARLPSGAGQVPAELCIMQGMSTSPEDHDEFTARLRERLGQVGPSTTLRDVVDEDVVVEVYRVEVDEETMRRHAAVTMRNGRRYHPYLQELWAALIAEARDFLPAESQDRLTPYEWAVRAHLTPPVPKADSKVAKESKRVCTANDDLEAAIERFYRFYRPYRQPEESPALRAWRNRLMPGELPGDEEVPPWPHFSTGRLVRRSEPVGGATPESRVLQLVEAVSRREPPPRRRR